jgi:hypothetical protein
MSKLGAFIRLDYGTIKPYLTLKNLILFGAMALVLSVINGSVSIGIGIGFMLGTLFTSYPFAIGEKSNLDALYSTLGLDRKTVVIGRFLFVVLLNVGCILFSLAVATFGVFGASALNIWQDTGGGSSLTTALILSVILLLIQLLQLPLFFKLGYTKAKLMSVLPFALFGAVFGVVTGLAKSSDFSDELDSALSLIFGNQALFFAVIVLLIVLVAAGSYRWAVTSYKKREF